MKLLLFSILMLFNPFEIESQSYSALGKEYYILEYYSKIYGQGILCFIETQDSIALKTTFKVYYTKNKISRVKKIADNADSFKYKYQKKEDGNIFVYGLNKVCYSSKNFKEKKYYSEDFYTLLSSNFLDIDNKERMEILNKLAH